MFLIHVCMQLCVCFWAQVEQRWHGLGVGSNISRTPFTHYIPRLGGAPSCWVSIDSLHFIYIRECSLGRNYKHR